MDLNLRNRPSSRGKKKPFHQKQMSEQQIVKHLHDPHGSSATPHTVVHLRFTLYSISGGWYYVYSKHEKADLTEALKQKLFISQLLRGRVGFAPRPKSLSGFLLAQRAQDPRSRNNPFRSRTTENG